MTSGMARILAAFGLVPARVSISSCVRTSGLTALILALKCASIPLPGDPDPGEALGWPVLTTAGVCTSRDPRFGLIEHGCTINRADFWLILGWPDAWNDALWASCRVPVCQKLTLAARFLVAVNPSRPRSRSAAVARIHA